MVVPLDIHASPPDLSATRFSLAGVAIARRFRAPQAAGARAVLDVNRRLFAARARDYDRTGRGKLR